MSGPSWVEFVAIAAVFAVTGLVAYSARRLGNGSSRLVALFGVVAASVVAVTCFVRSSGFYSDDFFNFRQAQVEGLSLRYLLEPTSAHVAPGHRLGDWAIQRFAPMNFPLAAGLLLVGFVLVLLMFHRLLAELFRPGPVPIVLTFLFGLSTVQVFILQWWASGLDRIPATILTFGSMLAYLRFFRTRDPRWLAASVAAFVLALAFYVKPVFIPVYLVLLRVLLLEPQRPVRETLAAAAREWRVWCLYLVPAAAYAVLYVSQYQAEGQVYPSSARNLSAYLWNLWFRVVSPGVFGLQLHDNRSATIALTVVVQALLVGAVVWTLVRRRGAWRAWTFFAVAFMLNALTVGLTRIGYFGPRYIAFTLHYNQEALFLLLIAGGAAWFGTRFSDHCVRATQAGHGVRARQAATPRSLPSLGTSSSRGLLVLGLAGYTVFSLLGDRAVMDRLHGPAARAYLARTQHALSQVRERDPDGALVDGVVPDYVVFHLAGPYVSYSEVFPVIDDGVVFDTRSRGLFDVTEDGQARSVEFVRDEGGEVLTLVKSSALSAVGVAVRFDGDRACVRATAKVSALVLTLKAPVAEGTTHLSLRYAAAARSPVGIVTEPLAGGKPEAVRFVRWQPSADHQTVLGFSSHAFQRLYLVLDPGSEVCVQDIEVGHLVARPSNIERRR